VTLEDRDHQSHLLAVGYSPGERSTVTLDGAPLERLLDDERRPLVSVLRPTASS